MNISDLLHARRDVGLYMIFDIVTECNDEERSDGIAKYLMIIGYSVKTAVDISEKIVKTAQRSDFHYYRSINNVESVLRGLKGSAEQRVKVMLGIKLAFDIACGKTALNDNDGFDKLYENEIASVGECDDEQIEELIHQLSSRFAGTSVTVKAFKRIVKAAASNKKLLNTVIDEYAFDKNLQCAVACEYCLRESQIITPEEAAEAAFIPAEAMRLYDSVHRGATAEEKASSAILFIIAVASLLVGAISCLTAISIGILYGLVIFLSACGIYQLCDNVMSKFPHWLGRKIVIASDCISKKRSEKLSSNINDDEFEILDKDGNIIEDEEIQSK